MNILVCVKQVPSTNKVRIDPLTGVLKRNGINNKMNPYDLYALETAFRLKERQGGKVSVISMGPPQAQAVLYEAFSMGADEGALISDRRFGGADVLATSYTISQGIKKLGEFDLILCGKQTTDGDTAQVGPEISEWLDMPCVCNVREIMGIQGNSIEVKMEMFGHIEVSRVQFPCLLTVNEEICQPRLPSYRRKMKTKECPIRTLTLNDLDDKDEGRYGLSGSPTQVQKIFPPTSDKKRELWTGGGKVLAGRMFEQLRESKFI